MGYEIHVQRFQKGKSEFAIDHGVWELLEEAWGDPPDEQGFAHLKRGGGEADLHAAQVGEPIDSLMFSRPAGGAEIFDLIVEVARAGDMVILAPGLPPCLVDGGQRAHLPADLIEQMGEPIVVADGNDLLSAIQDT